MLTPEILAKQFVTAHFIDNDRTQIEVLTLENVDSNNQISTVIEYDPDHPWCQALLEVCNLDTLHENTWNKINKEKTAFEQSVLKIARDQGLVYGTHKAETKFHTAMMDFLFNYQDKDKRRFICFQIIKF